MTNDQSGISIVDSVLFKSPIQQTIYNIDVGDLLSETGEDSALIGRVFSALASSICEAERECLQDKLKQAEGMLGTPVEDARLMLRGALLLEEQLYARAIDAFSNALRHNRTNEWAFAKMGLAKAHLWVAIYPKILELYTVAKSYKEEIRTYRRKLDRITDNGLFWGVLSLGMVGVLATRYISKVSELGKSRSNVEREAEIAMNDLREVLVKRAYRKDMSASEKLKFEWRQSGISLRELYETIYADLNKAIELNPKNQELRGIKDDVHMILQKYNFPAELQRATG